MSIHSIFGMLAGGNLNEFLVGEIIRNLPDGVSEIMTHPGMDAESLEKLFPGSIIGKMSFRLFFLKKNKCLLEQKKVTLINFGGL